MNRHTELLRLYNQWRRGDIEHLDFTAKEIGEAIDGVLEERAELLESLEKLHAILSKGGVWTIEDQKAAYEAIVKAKGGQG